MRKIKIIFTAILFFALFRFWQIGSMISVLNLKIVWFTVCGAFLLLNLRVLGRLNYVDEGSLLVVEERKLPLKARIYLWLRKKVHV